MMFNYSITLYSFKNWEKLEKTLENLKQCDIKTLEIIGEPDLLDVKYTYEIIKSFGFSVSGVTGIWGISNNSQLPRNFLTQDTTRLSYTENYVKKCIEMCSFFGGKTFNICIFADPYFVKFDKNHRVVPERKKSLLCRKLNPVFFKLSEYAKDYGITLVLEPLNRYSTPYCNQAKNALDICLHVGHENFALMLDTFHMNIEEDSIEKTIIYTKNYLKHIHFSDNNRKMPGFGHIDFKKIIDSLSKIQYSRVITFEPTFATGSYLNKIKKSLNYLNTL